VHNLASLADLTAALATSAPPRGEPHDAAGHGGRGCVASAAVRCPGTIALVGRTTHPTCAWRCLSVLGLAPTPPSPSRGSAAASSGY
jgi:hypothetical protein